MASIEKRGKRWRAKVRRSDVSESKTFATKQQAMQWVLERERQIDAGFKGRDRTLHEMLDEYAEKVSPTKRGCAWELKRIGAMKRDLPNKPLRLYTPDDLGKWRDKRLQAIKGESFIRDLTLLSSAWEAARREWKWCETNPCRDVRRPPRSLGRERLISDAERDEMLASLGWGGSVILKKDEVALAFQLALETAMRAGEIIGIKPENVRGDHVVLPMTKNGRRRAVPLSPAAQALLKLVPAGFTLNAQQLDGLFRKYRPAHADYVFHDTRHTAVTRLARILPILDLARMVGHSDTRTLLRYYNATASDIAKLLAGPAGTKARSPSTSASSSGRRRAAKESQAE